ncbi:hypothetical protein [Desulfosporosinus sp. BG]|uniref:hypothetical protein n=1 Tax=Desulfosporosinus sp. BG TaxID=1633135 RepID=UPI000858EF94|nr:hypothetical protein [Desulfosporosinus sp. BG]ODA43022.1 hypothetical protein DSBG_0018 [Desulfosporosinus sp. BG]
MAGKSHCQSQRQRGIPLQPAPALAMGLEGKLQLHDKNKVIPPERIMQESLDQSLHDKLGQRIAAEILEQHHHEDQIAEAVRQVKERCGDIQTRLAETVPAELGKEPVQQWRDVVEDVSEEMIKNCPF